VFGKNNSFRKGLGTDVWAFAKFGTMGTNSYIDRLLIIFDPGKLPEVGKSIANANKEFRKSSTEALGQVEGAQKQEASFEVKKLDF